MNSLNRFRPAKQFRCLPLVGKESPFGYEQIVRTAAGGHNYQSCSEVVGAFSEMNEKGRAAWSSLTGNSKITVVCQSGLSAGSPLAAASSTCETATRMSASVRLSSSSENLQS